jgi:TonB-linked SusC/RagA family outer membrane protein
VRLSKNVQQMNEVVVTALGVKREKRNLTYSTQEVKGEQLLATKEPNVINALAGKVSGVQITSASGSPGSSSRIVIRGTTSIYGDNQALIVVDGIPINNDETGNLNSGPGSNRLIDIDPSIIETINVLKGAAATALYGSAGARGVVFITTKSGSDKKPVITFSSDLSYEKPILPEKQMKYGQGNRGVFFNGETQKTSTSWGPLMDTLKINGQPAPKYDPYDLFFKTGVTNNNTVSVNGGSNASNYFMSYSYFDQKGTVPKTSLYRHSIFTKYTNRIAKNLSSTFQFNYSNTKNDRMPEGYILESPIWTVITAPVSWNPLPYLNPDGTQRVYRFSRNNPYWVLDNIYNRSQVNRFIPLMTFNYTPLSWLTLTERVGTDIYSEQDKYREAPSTALATTGRITEQNINFRQFNHDFIINANKQAGDFDLNLIVGNNLFSTYTQYYYERGVGLSIDNFDNISSASTITSSETHYRQRKVGFYAQANIDYKRFLILSLTGRYDGSSVLSTDKNFYPYGSVAGSFIFSEFLPGNSFLSFGKLRLSYATVGNDNVGPYSLSTPYVTPTFGNITFPFQGQSGFLLSSTLGNPDLKNERLNEYEVGLETKMFKNRIGLEASYFYKKTINGLIPGVAIAPSTGYTGTTVNTASIENKGIEILLNANPVKSGKFNWDFTFNFSRIPNKVLELYPGTNQLGNGFTQVIVGQPYGVKFGGRYKRTADGQLIINAAGIPVRADEDGIIGNITPDWLAGLSNTLRYGPLSLSFFFDMRKGGDIENNVDGYGYFYGTPKVTENRDPRVIPGISEVDNKPNTVKADMQTYYQTINGIVESVIQDATYIKLRTVSLGYDLPVSTSKRLPFKTASLVLTGRNLWIYSPHFTGGDPEASSFGSSNGAQGIFSFASPTSRSINLSLKFSF